MPWSGLAGPTLRTMLSAAAWLVPALAPARAGDVPDIARRLIAGYPGIVNAVSGNKVAFTDASALPLDDGKGVKTFAEWLNAPDIEDMFEPPYAAGEHKSAPRPMSDPGRARNQDFFAKVYGDCRKGEVERRLADVVWLGRKKGGRLKVTSVNGVAARLAAVSAELDALPQRFDKFLLKPAGGYNCRKIAGTQQMSPHGYGIAVDIAPGPAHYWRWDRAAEQVPPLYRNTVPFEIVAIFEKHGFIWGGKWSHFDTMHFEYRPELLPPSVPLPPAAGP